MENLQTALTTHGVKHDRTVEIFRGMPRTSVKVIEWDQLLALFAALFIFFYAYGLKVVNSTWPMQRKVYLYAMIAIHKVFRSS